MKTRKFIALIFLIFFILILTQCAPAETEEYSGEPVQDEQDEQDGQKQEGDTDMIPETVIEKAGGDNVGSLTSTELVHKMTAGWNLGNTFDAHWNGPAWGVANFPEDQERMWGNPSTTKAMIDKIKESGFNTVRIPVTWYMFTGPGPDYIIDAMWMDRVQEVVDYVIDNGMFCILNIHHDDYKRGDDWEIGWFRMYDAYENRPFSDSEKAALHRRFARIWEQIAERFKDYDEHLLFEGINEPRTEDMHNPTNEVWAENFMFLNELLQTFVNTVRAGGGKNPDRHLLVCPYYASVGTDVGDGEGRIALFVDGENGKLRISDPRGRLIASLHYYEPWGFVAAPDDSPWHSWYFDLSVGSVSWNLDVTLRIIRDNFIAHGIPVIMGETGAIFRTMPDGGSNEAEVVKWVEYYVVKLKEMGIPTVIWDDGGWFKLFDRENLEWLYPGVAAALSEAGKTPVRN
jgi:endoglucanase